MADIPSSYQAVLPFIIGRDIRSTEWKALASNNHLMWSKQGAIVDSVLFDPAQEPVSSTFSDETTPLEILSFEPLWVPQRPIGADSEDYVLFIAAYGANFELRVRAYNPDTWTLVHGPTSVGTTSLTAGWHVGQNIITTTATTPLVLTFEARWQITGADSRVHSIAVFEPHVSDGNEIPVNRVYP